MYDKLQFVVNRRDELIAELNDKLKFVGHSLKKLWQVESRS